MFNSVDNNDYQPKFNATGIPQAAFVNVPVVKTGTGLFQWQLFKRNARTACGIIPQLAFSIFALSGLQQQRTKTSPLKIRFSLNKESAEY